MYFFNLRDWATGQRILATDLQGFSDRHNAVYPLSFSGNVKVHGGFKHGTAVHIPHPPDPVFFDGFWAEIGSPTPVADEDNQWDYEFTEKQRTALGWQTKEGGRTGTARNSVEANNGATGVMGNSIDHDGPDYPAGFALQAVQGAPIVWIRASRAADTGETVYTFQYENAEDGTCEEA